MEPPKTLLLTETGLESLPDGSIAVNVGPIVRALKFLTEGRGDDRGLDEAGNPLPDLMSLAFEVVESIIVGGRKADYFRHVKSQLDAQAGAAGRSSLALAKRASRVQPATHAAAEAAALERAADTLQALLAGLQGATTQLLDAMNALGVRPQAKRKTKAKAKAKTPQRRAAPKEKRSAPRKRAAKRKRKSR